MQAFHLLILGLCLLLFTASATTDLALPGPQDDECVHACLAIDLMRPPHPFSKAYTLHLGNQPFPFGVDPHTGALKAYMLWPFFSLFGPSVEVMRLFTISLGLLTLLFCYLFAREISGPWPAFFSLLLLSLDSSFLFYSKLDAGPIMEQLLWMMVALWSFTQWRKRQRSFYLLLILLSGLFGIYSHITFIWFLSACFVAALLCFPKEALRLFQRPAVYLVIPTTLCMLAIFLYWLVGEKVLLSREPPGFVGASIMLERVSVLAGIIPDVFLGKLTPHLSPLMMKVRPPTDIFLASSAVFLLCRYRRQTDLVRFLFLVAGIMFLEISWTPGDFVYLPHRMMVFYLFLIFFGGLAIAQSLHLLRNFKTQPFWLKAASSGILLLAFLSISGQLLLKQEADQKIRQTGGRGFWADEMYPIAETLKRGKWEKVICLDWGIRRPLFLLTKGELFLTEPLWGIPADEKVKQEILLQIVQQASPHTLFLLKPEGGVVPKLREVAREISRRIRLEQIFRDRGGDPLCMAYTVQVQSP